MTQTRSKEQVRAHIQGMWASVAASWGASADDIDQRVAPITERMLDAVAVHTGDRVLELASGPGGAGVQPMPAVPEADPARAVTVDDPVVEDVKVKGAEAVAPAVTAVAEGGDSPPLPEAVKATDVPAGTGLP